MTAEQLRRPLDVAQGQGGADGGRRDLVGVVGDLAVRTEQVDPFDGKAGFTAHGAQELDVSPTSVTEVEVLPDHDHLGPEAVDQDLADEVLRRLLGTLLVEADDEEQVETGGLQQFQLLLGVGQQQGGALGADQAGGVLVEGDQRGRDPPVSGQLPHPVDDGPVPEMDTVVGPDGDHRATRERRAGPRVPHHLHADEGTPLLLAPDSGALTPKSGAGTRRVSGRGRGWA